MRTTAISTHAQILDTLASEVEQARISVLDSNGHTEGDLDGVIDIEIAAYRLRGALDELLGAMASVPTIDQVTDRVKLDADRIRALAVAGDDDWPPMSQLQAQAIVGTLLGAA